MRLHASLTSAVVLNQGTTHSVGLIGPVGGDHQLLLTFVRWRHVCACGWIAAGAGQAFDIAPDGVVTSVVEPLPAAAATVNTTNAVASASVANATGAVVDPQAMPTQEAALQGEVL